MFRLKLFTVIGLALGFQIMACGQTLKKVPVSFAGPVFAPSVNATEDLLIFQSNANPYKAWQLQVSTYSNDSWQKPAPLAAISDYGAAPAADNNFQGDFIGTPSLNASGDTLYFAATFKSGLGGKDLYYSIRHNDTWSAPVSLGPRINTTGGEESPSISSDGRSLYFTRRAGAEGCYTIYASIKEINGGWGKPVALPASVNQGCEKGPRILADNVTLVFSSQREGRADMDLYVSVRSITGVWTNPRRVAELSTAGSDGFATVVGSGNSVYFSSLNGGTGTLYQCSPVPDLLKLQRFQMLACTLVDSITGKQLSGEVKLSLEGDRPELLEHLHDVTGFTKQLYGAAAFRLTAEADGYERKSWVINPRYDSDSLTMQLRLHPTGGDRYAALSANHTQRVLFNGDSIRQEKPVSTLPASVTGPKENAGNSYKPGHCSVQFATGESVLSTHMQTALLTLVAYARLHRESQVEITGHADDVGDDAFNMTLSALRSEAIKKYLLEMGVHENQIVTQAVGEAQPLVSNSSGANRAKNRRAIVRLK